MANLSTNSTSDLKVSISTYLALYRKITKEEQRNNNSAGDNIQVDDTIAAKIKNLAERTPSDETIDAIMKYAAKTGLQ